ncbi:RagB/SusD family nutrient uptake outer membrane protein [Dysgonomonas sp. Marseille-P4677]|uniref:RagB/SusD family nutrient uptake outer membrane protein n=1 Tax=Dysgonomonas sp. Marseille-P4677 TaxID=2364790 RepID=UPI001913CE94|nr:RagB/SusD family nutrient uptake outer membrane protein [Dysgonomonas sp. Marseille-P4677]MBK5720587.1 RagB/SusD family nutrient uptake outer membrane protein [Dysgonomonas sp. Marseille-P4677]
MRFHKIYISIFCMIASSLLMSSCDGFLDENPENKKGSNQFWASKSDAETAVNALYFGGVPYLHSTDVDGGWTPKATMWGGIISGLYVDKRKDRTFTTASEGCNFNVPAFDSPAMKLWHEFYKGISRANFVIANIPTMAGVIDEPTMANYVAQGKFFRAYGYFYLVKEFGDVPYISEPYRAPVDMYKERISAEQVYKNIEEDLLSIIQGDVLPNKAFYDNGCYVTKPMAQTLLAQVYLQWAGAPLNGGDTYYTKAANMALDVIRGGQHALIQPNGSSDDLTSAYNEIKTTKKSNEIIYAKEFNETLDQGNSYPSRSMGAEASQWGVFGGGTIYNAYLPCDMIIQSYETNDIRSHEKQFFFRNWTEKDKDGNDITFTLGDIGNWAWFDETALKMNKSGNYNMPTFRYAEVLLIAAEGLARTGKEADAEGGAKFYLNQVRKRAGLDKETATGDALIQSILTERLHEFPLEFKVWDDIRRTRLYPEADGVNSGKLKWTPLTSATIQNKPDGFTRVGAIPEYALLWPLPLDEIQRNPSLQGHQNPGWN